MRRQTRLDHEERMEAAIRYIVEHLDEPIDLRDLADHVCLSRFYFHRLFQALVGETVGELVRRLRLERAATRLRTSDTPITELAFEAGYATHEAFIRAFRAAFGCTPSAMRRRLTYEGQLPTPNGVHYLYYDDPEATPAAELRSDAGVIVPQEFVTDDPRVHVVDIAGGMYAVGTHVGPYDGLPNAWGEMVGQWLPSSGYTFGDSPGFERYLDNCPEVPAAELRTEICVPIQPPAG
jgi:AraC family transcriptional regulator